MTLPDLKTPPAAIAGAIAGANAAFSADAGRRRWLMASAASLGWTAMPAWAKEPARRAAGGQAGQGNGNGNGHGPRNGDGGPPSGLPGGGLLRQLQIPLQAVGAVIEPLDGGAIQLAHHGDRPLNPASTMKLVTTLAAMELLGPQFRWTTRILATAPIRDGVLDGDLVLEGGGDPKLVYEDLVELVTRLRALGLKEIRGKLIVDARRFSLPEEDPGRFDNEPLKPYNVAPHPMMMNFNTVKLAVVGDPTQGPPVPVVEPAPLGIEVINRLQWGGQPGRCDGVTGQWLIDVQSGARPPKLAVSGSVPAQCPELVTWLAPLPHREFIPGTFRQLWERAGGVISADYTELRESRPGREIRRLPGARMLLEWASSSQLVDVVRDINKFSNNVMARQLLLSLADQQLRISVGLDEAQRVIKHWLLDKGLLFQELVIENGSGLSRRERISPAHLGRLLSLAWQSPLRDAFRESLPLVGVDGTMRRRLKDHDVAGRAWIKTGTLNDVKSVAGYVQAASGKWYAVVGFVNHARAGETTPWLDHLITYTYKHG